MVCQQCSVARLICDTIVREFVVRDHAFRFTVAGRDVYRWCCMVRLMRAIVLRGFVGRGHVRLR